MQGQMRNRGGNRALQGVLWETWPIVVALALLACGAFAAAASANTTITWKRHHIPVRGGVAGRRLCQVTVDAAEAISSVRFSSPATAEVEVVPAGPPRRRGAAKVFFCRVETKASAPPPSVPVKATVMDAEGEAGHAMATAELETPVPGVSTAHQAEGTAPPPGHAASVSPPSGPSASSPPPAETGATPAPAPPSAPGQLFSPSSFWNRPLPNAAPLVPQSAAQVQELVNQVGRTGAWINTTSWSTPVYVVGTGQPTTKVTIVPNNGGYVDPSQQAALNAVPMPANAAPAAGSDRHMVVWQPSTDSMWEFWDLRLEGGRWVTDSSGAMDDVSTSPGYFEPNGWAGAKSWWGATATSLPLLGGLIRVGELESGTIPHALAIALPETGSSFVWPAQRSDGRNRSASAIPEGTTFRLPASLDIEGLGLPPATRAIALAAQKYGIVVRDTSSDVTFYAEDPTPLGSNPYSRLFGGQSPAALLARFPWSQLVAVQQQTG
jgi:hypothetical protein